MAAIGRRHRPRRDRRAQPARIVGVISGSIPDRGQPVRQPADARVHERRRRATGGRLADDPRHRSRRLPATRQRRDRRDEVPDPSSTSSASFPTAKARDATAARRASESSIGPVGGATRRRLAERRHVQRSRRACAAGYDGTTAEQRKRLADGTLSDELGSYARVDAPARRDDRLGVVRRRRLRPPARARSDDVSSTTSARGGSALLGLERFTGWRSAKTGRSISRPRRSHGARRATRNEARAVRVPQGGLARRRARVAGKSRGRRRRPRRRAEPAADPQPPARRARPRPRHRPARRAGRDRGRRGSGAARRVRAPADRGAVGRADLGLPAACGGAAVDRASLDAGPRHDRWQRRARGPGCGAPRGGDGARRRASCSQARPASAWCRPTASSGGS